MIPTVVKPSCQRGILISLRPPLPFRFLLQFISLPEEVGEFLLTLLNRSARFFWHILSLHLDCFYCTEFSIHPFSCRVVTISSDFHIVGGSFFQFGNRSGFSKVTISCCLLNLASLCKVYLVFLRMIDALDLHLQFLSADIRQFSNRCISNGSLFPAGIQGMVLSS